MVSLACWHEVIPSVNGIAATTGPKISSLHDLHLLAWC